uniref:Uncharacterized protein n=1 Tax=Panagrolaimus sp. ES5 TaxID=591445 RepID=A0AC34F742_9BILA
MPHFFTDDENLMFTNLLIASNILPKIDDLIITVMVDEDNNLAVGKLKYTEIGYEKSMECLPPNIQEKNVEKFRQQIIGNENPKKIILYSSKSGLAFFKMLRNAVLKSKKLIAIEKGFEEFMGKSVAEICKWVKDRSNTRFHIISTCAKIFTITDKPDNFDNPLCIVLPREKIPLTKAFFVMESKNIYIVSFSLLKN